MEFPWAFLMNKTFDVIVIGLGCMGSSATMQLSMRGQKVLGLEQFEPFHELGSSHGSTRAIRLSYYEHPSYVPLLKRAYDIWHELEWLTGETLIDECGCLTIGKPQHEVIQGIRQSAGLHHLKLSELNAREIRNRFPVFQPEDDEIGLLEPHGGFVWARRCLQAFQNISMHNGASLHYGEVATSLEFHGNGVTVKTNKSEYHAGRVVLCAGPWVSKFLGPAGNPIRLMRQTLHWFTPSNPVAFSRFKTPVFMFAKDQAFYYGFPLVEPAGVKIARHYGQPEVAKVEQIDRMVHPEDEISIRKFLAGSIPSLQNSASAQSKGCIYTLTPDRHFLLGALQNYPQMIVAGGFSGHGFKFASVVGEVVADICINQNSNLDLKLFHPERFMNDNP